MTTYKVLARPRDRRRSVDTILYPVHVEKDSFSRVSRRGSVYDNKSFFEREEEEDADDRDAKSHALILAEPSRRSRENRALVTYPGLRRSKSQARFREDASIIEEESREEPTDGQTYVRSRRRAGQRPAHALVRSKSRRRRNSDEDEPDLEYKTSRTNRKFREKRNNLENEEASVLIKAKHHDRERRSSQDEETQYRPSEDGYYRTRDWETASKRDRRPRIEIPSDDERDIVVVPRNRRRRESLDEATSHYSGRSAYPKTERSYREERSNQSTRARSPVKERRGSWLRKGERLPRSEEWYYRQDRELVNRMKGLAT